MAEGHAEAERRPDRGQPRRPPDSTSLVGAIERMRAEVDSLARAVQASPEAVAARIDVDGAAAGVARRVDALGSALVQLRLSLLASLERTEARLDEPPWLTSLQATLAELTSGTHPVPSASSASQDLGDRLAALEFNSGTVAADARLLVERVGLLPERLAAVAAQVDRITPLARSADDAGSLLGQLTRVSTGLEKVLTHLDRDALAARPARPDDLAADVGFQGVLDVLAGVIRRQDTVATAVTAILEQLNGPTGVVAAITRMAQRERAVDLRLDRTLAEPVVREHGPEAPAVEVARADDDLVRAAVVTALELQEEAFAGRLARLDATIRALADQAKAVDPAPGPTLESVLQRLDRQERTMASRLEWVGDRLAEVAVHLVGVEEPTAEASGLTDLRSAIEERLEAVGDAVTGLSRHQEAVTDNLSRLVAQIPPPPDPSASALAGSRLDAVRDAVAGLARRQEALTANLARVVAQMPPPPDPSASAVAARRLEELRNERVSVQARLQEERFLAAQSWSNDDHHDDSASGDDDLDDDLDLDLDLDLDDDAPPRSRRF